MSILADYNLTLSPEYLKLVSRILLLLPFLLWMTWLGGRESGAAPAAPDLEQQTAIFLGVYALLVLFMGLWSRLLARRVSSANLQQNLRRFNRAMFGARLFVPAWFAAGLFILNWGSVVTLAMSPLASATPLELPSLLVATLPALLAWMALWWSSFPADRALREQSILMQLDDNLPVHAPPTFRKYFTANLRLQILFTLAPVLVILLARDLIAMLLWLMNVSPDRAPAIEACVMLLATATVFVYAPVILRAVLHTEPLPHSPLRLRLEMLCRQHNLRYRDILLWHTDNNMGNAAVMGMLPRLRYILLSDLLLETMTDEQIEAVFAHELGHVVHRHMAWYVIFFLIMMAIAAGPGELLHAQLGRFEIFPGDRDLLMLLIGISAFLLSFGFLSRRFERQADVFAARTIEPPGAHVGQHGAMIFASALHRVAVINNIPVAARSWCHGSIATRMNYLRHLSTDPALTGRFDRFMLRLYIALLLILFASAASAAYLSAAYIA